jgi:hypothetical protein
MARIGFCQQHQSILVLLTPRPPVAEGVGGITLRGASKKVCMSSGCSAKRNHWK